jgi:8-oxo-dGTP diphosphatase
MTLLLVRHAVALRRSDWKQPDHLRPLTPRGYAQAEALPELLAARPVDRVLSSPFLRCVETVTPLAARLALPVEELPQLAEGGGTSAAALLGDLGGTVVLCSHGDVVPDLLAVLAPSVLAGGGDVPCEKGSTWVVEDDGRASYLPPPA